MNIRVGDIDVGYDRTGSGDPVLLVMGLGATRIGWFTQIPVLSGAYDVITFDNRGVGETTAPTAQWTLDDMVSDAIGLLDALAIDTFHLAGISMGGMISQEIAIQHPNRVRSLALLSTQHGGPDSIPPDPEVLMALATFDGDAAAHAQRVLQYTFGRKFREEHPEIVDMAIAFQTQNPAPLHGLMNQVMAIAQWTGQGGSAARLGRISVPTLVMHGTDDRLIPVGNAKLIADAVPGARLEIFEDIGHALNAEASDAVNSRLLNHLAEASVRA